GGTLAETAPVGAHLQASSIGRPEGQVPYTLYIDHRGGDALGVQVAGGVALAAVDPPAIAIAGQAGGAVVGGLGAQLGQGVAQASPGQDLGIEAPLLLGGAVHP